MKTKNNKNRTSKKLVSRCSIETILQLSNDLSEGIESGDTSKWRAVALYFRDQVDKQNESIMSLRMSLVGLTLAEKMRTVALREIEKWLKGKNNENKEG